MIQTVEVIGFDLFEPPQNAISERQIIMGREHNHLLLMKRFMTSEIDERNQDILNESLSSRNAKSGPLIGDFLELPDGSMKRLSVHHRSQDEFQAITLDQGSFNLTSDGLCDYSGRSEFDLINRDHIYPAGKIQKGSVSFFSHGEVKAGGLITVLDVPFQVWLLK